MVGHDETARLAQTMLDFRRIRPGALPPGLFGEGGWELLLELFIADASGRRMTAGQFARDSGANLDTTSRWLMYLTNLDYIEGDGSGDLDDPLTLTGKGMAEMEALMSQARALRRAMAGG